ncbi:hypothetical protein WISP_09197 [Willisornis vidua]|uniref:RNA-directed DNA polymerase n=1 Tax=Willisornis vidua TaxID=1566151 RepID=A0ABQ9DSJ1_9PASS|nr:hypothetical protein WISP_09197 [Willisornis vidua]
MQIGVIDHPVDVLHPEIWDKCTKALAQETMSSGHGKNLKAWGKVVQALQKAIQEQETWKVAEKRLLAAPKLGVGATTQTLCPPTTNVFNSDSAVEEQEQVGTSYSELAKEARTAMENAGSETVKDRPLPCVSRDGAEVREEGRGEGVARGKSGELAELVGVCGEEGEENSGEGAEKGDGSDRKGGRRMNGEKNVNQKEKYLSKASAPSKGRDKRRGKVGNDKADAAAKGLWTLRDARQLHESLHTGAKVLVKKYGVMYADAKHIVVTCPYCQKSPLWSRGVNPRGLKVSEIWQTDFTLCQLSKSQPWLAVTVDTYSGAIVATQHLKTDSKATIQHWLTAMAWLGVPNQIKTDNGSNFISKSVRAFVQKWDITLIHGIPYNSTGQAIYEQDQIIGCPRNPYVTVPEKNNGLTDVLFETGGFHANELRAAPA